MKIALNALTLPKSLAGIGFYTEQLILGLLAVDPGIEIALFTNGDAAAGLGSVAGRIRMQAFHVPSTIGKALAAQILLPSRLNGFGLLHSVGNVGLRFCPIPQVATIHDLCQKAVPQRFGFAKKAYLNIGEEWTVRKCERIIAVSHSTASDLVRFFPGASGKTVTIHSASKFKVDKTASSGGGFLFVGTLEPGKNLPMTLQALARLRDRHGILGRLRVVGARGWKQTFLPELIGRLGLEPQVEFLGYLDDMALREEYRSAACFLFPSMYEGFGLPILEAQSQGCPVISADNSSLREIGGEGCYYFPSGDIDALAGLMLRALNDPGEFRRIREEGFANCARFDWERTARETLEVYRNVVQD